MRRPGAAMIFQVQTLLFGYALGKPGEVMMPFEVVNVPPHTMAYKC